MQFQREPLSSEKKDQLIKWLVQPERQALVRLVESQIAAFEVAASNAGVEAQRTAFDSVINPQLNAEQRQLLSLAAEWRLFLSRLRDLEEMANNDELFTGTITY